MLRYGVQLGDDPAPRYAAVDDAFVPLLVGRGRGDGRGAGRGARRSTVTGAEVSAVTRDARRAAGRAPVQPDRPSRSTARLAGRRGWRTDLRGRSGPPFDETVDLDPWAIATLIVTED